MDILCPKCGGATPTQEVDEALSPCAECSFCGTVYWPEGPVDVEESVKGMVGNLPGRPSTHLKGRFVQVNDGASEDLEGRQGLVEEVEGPFCRVLLDETETRVWVPAHWLDHA